LEAAQQATDRGIRVFTIGFGTENGSSFPNCPDQYLGNEPFGGFRSGGNQQPGGRFRRGIDEETLKAIAQISGGEYYPATSSGELHEVFQKRYLTLITKHEARKSAWHSLRSAHFLAALALFFLCSGILFRKYFTFTECSF
jgi:Ca-activated chloride channel family protein